MFWAVLTTLPLWSLPVPGRARAVPVCDVSITFRMMTFFSIRALWHNCDANKAHFNQTVIKTRWFFFPYECERVSDITLTERWTIKILQFLCLKVQLAQNSDTQISNTHTHKRYQTGEMRDMVLERRRRAKERELISWFVLNLIFHAICSAPF